MPHRRNVPEWLRLPRCRDTCGPEMRRAGDGTLARWVTAAASALAVAGGLVLLGMALVTAAAISGRAASWLPVVMGDFELVEMGTAVAVMCFMPWCQLGGGQVTVDILSERLGRWHHRLGAIGQALLLLVSVVVLWRFWLGFGEKFPFGSDALRAALGMGSRPWFTETTYDLMIPMWIPFALCLPGAALWVAACMVTFGRAFREALS